MIRLRACHALWPPGPRRHRHGLYASIALALLCLAPPCAAETTTRIVLYFGDSITAGSQLAAERRTTDRWPAVLEKISAGRFTEHNEGLGGRSTDSVADFDAALARHSVADLLVLALGTNDSRDLSPDSVQKAVGRIRQMIAHAHASHPALRILLVGPPNLNLGRLGRTKPIGPQRAANLQALNVAYASLASELHCGFVSFYGVVPPDALAADGVHPDAEGNRALARAALPALNALTNAL